MALTTTVVVPGTAHAVGEPAVCTVSGNVTVSPGVNIEPQYQRFRFVGVAIMCPVGVGHNVGNYTGLTAVGGSIHPESCPAGVGAGHFTGGNGPPGNGAVVGGTFYYARIGVLVVAAGGVRTTLGGPPLVAGGFNHLFAAVLVFWPGTTTPPALPTETCGAKLLGQVVNNATITGVAVIDDVPGIPLPEPTHPCPLAVDPLGFCKGHPFPF